MSVRCYDLYLWGMAHKISWATALEDSPWVKMDQILSTFKLRVLDETYVKIFSRAFLKT